MTGNILIDTLPDRLTVGGAPCAIYTDYRHYILLELLLADREASPAEKAEGALQLVYVRPPAPFEEAVDRLLWFYQCGRPVVPAAGVGTGNPARQRRIYDFEVDAPLIYAAFLTQYGLDLTEVSLHWWKFCALFQALEEGHEISKIMNYRAADLSKIQDKERRRFYARMQAQYRLPDPRCESEKAAAAGAIFGGMR